MNKMERSIIRRMLCVGTLLIATSFGSANALPILTVNLTNATETGLFEAVVTLEEVVPASGIITVNADISGNDGISQGDILGLFFNVSAGTDLTGFVADEGSPNPIICYYPNNTCTIASNANQVPGTFFIGVQVGVQGSAGGFQQVVSFDMFTTAGLTLAAFENQLVGMRVQSIAGTTKYTTSSAKLTGSGSIPVSSPGSLALLGIGAFGFGVARRLRIC